MDRAHLLNLYKQMLLIRRFEERCAEMYALGKIGGFCHLYIGEEAVAVGAVDALRPDDYVFSAYRDHGHCLARGSEPKRVMAELFGRQDGLCKGKGGSMHLIDAQRRFMGGYAIVGGHLPLAAGVAYAIRYRGGDQVVLCFFGEGAVPSGACHETLNLAALWGLPVLFLCENNRYGMGTPVHRAVALYQEVSQNAAAYGIESGCVDGMDVLAVRDAVSRAIGGIRRNQQPYFLEALTYRFLGHSMADPAHGHYRTKEEVDLAKKRDPLLLLKDKLLSERSAAEADFKGVEEEVKKVMDEAVAFAEASPRPSLSDLEQDVYTGAKDGSHGTNGPSRRAGGWGGCSGWPGRAGVMTLTYREALNQALREEMRRDETVFLIGEDVAYYQGAFKVSKGFLEEFGPQRVVDTPITELGFTGLAVGAAMAGLHPVVELMTFNFALLAMDQIVNNAAKIRYMSGGQLSVPIVIRGPGSAAHQLAAQHSQSLEAWFCHVPGLKVVAPGTPQDAKGLLKSAIRDNNPVIFLEAQLLYPTQGEVEDGEHLIPLGSAEVKRAGKDVTLIAYSKMLLVALEAAEVLAQEGIEVEVVDPRTLRPLDLHTLAESVKKTGKAVIIEEGWPFAGLGAQIAESLYTKVFDYLDGPIVRVTGLDVPMPYARNLEDAAVPDVKRVVAAVRKMV